MYMSVCDYSGVKDESILSAALLPCVPHMNEQSTVCPYQMAPSTNLCLCKCVYVCGLSFSLMIMQLFLCHKHFLLVA